MEINTELWRMCAAQIIEMKAFLQNALWARKGLINCHFYWKKRGKKLQAVAVKIQATVQEIEVRLSERMVEITLFDLNKPTVL